MNSQSSAAEAVRYFLNRIEHCYYTECCNYIRKYISKSKPTKKREFRIVAENFCSYLLNYGYNPHVIFVSIKRQFFKNNVSGNQVREFDDFINNFSFNQKTYRALISASSAFAVVANQRKTDFVARSLSFPPEFRSKPTEWPETFDLYELRVDALDWIDARNRIEKQLSFVRGIAYSVTPAADLSWHKKVIIVHPKPSEYVAPVGNGVDAIRRTRWRSARKAPEYKRRLAFFVDRFTGPDRERLFDAMTTYASAYHAESLPAQLVSLWSSLEGLLPPPPDGSKSQIEYLARDLVACHKKMYWQTRFESIYHQLRRARIKIDTAMVGVVGPSKTPELKLASSLLLAQNKAVRDRIWPLCGDNTLARQRLWEVFEAAFTGGEDHAPSRKGVYDCVSDNAKKVDWQLGRIYRERNRVVHRAKPSETIEELVHSLNAYIEVVFEALLAQAELLPSADLNGIFADIRIGEDSRAAKASKGAYGKDPPHSSDFSLLLGMKID